MRALLLWCAIGAACLAGCGDDGAPISPTCTDGVQNGGESGVDCGGGVCGTCDEGDGCRHHGDCATGVCGDDGACVAVSCTDGQLNADETDVDCGGGCDACAAGDACAVADDCASGICTDGRCAGAACGDGVVNGDEECDDAGESATCNADCTAATCGDFVVNQVAGETCDEGGQATATCDADCTLRSCGDGVANTEAGEQCDTGVSSATCDLDCTEPLCGDGLLNTAADEICDDAGDSRRCDMDCTPAECGDDYANFAAGEDCDEGAVDTATCNFDCTAAACGDGYRNPEADEECDTAGDSDTCNADCTAAECGDGYVNEAAGEECDDGANVDGDGCSAMCLSEGCDIDPSILPAIVHSAEPLGQIAFDASCDLLIAGWNQGNLYRMSSADGSVSVAASGFPSYVLSTIYRESDDTILVGNYSPNELWQVDSSGLASFVTALPMIPAALEIGPPGFGPFEGWTLVVGTTEVLYAIDPSGSLVLPVAAGLGAWTDLEFSLDGTRLFVSDYDAGTIEAVTPDGSISVIASGLSAPEGLALSNDGSTLWVAHRPAGGRVDSVDLSTGVVTEGPNFVLSEGKGVTGMLFDSSGDLIIKTRDGSNAIIDAHTP